MIRIAIVMGSTRPGRRVDQVATWVFREAQARVASADDTVVELVDLADVALPLLDEPVPAAIGDYQHPHTRRWARAVASYDGFVFVVPEYNHSMPAALKNAIDYLFAEWNDKAAGFVSYGITGGTRAVEHLRLTLAEVKVACVRSQVALSLFTDFELTDPALPGTFRPGPHHGQILDRLLDEVRAWSRALAPLRPSTSPAAPDPTSDAAGESLVGG
ncbi:NADPH-dependent FMN reductase [Candidatus Frankia nodulisporulans]|uniref:NADPH-dependent FMN reductase n=1 Tax=Candidatus Frankia nodulisporulans TaxID=2060052 RepID=UPI0013D41B74|nr:NAD(P)H-dependent oxidoreductase [Candidatus Frankia nodulisporulans]